MLSKYANFVQFCSVVTFFFRMDEDQICSYGTHKSYTSLNKFVYKEHCALVVPFLKLILFSICFLSDQQEYNEAVSKLSEARVPRGRSQAHFGCAKQWDERQWAETGTQKVPREHM